MSWRLTCSISDQPLVLLLFSTKEYLTWVKQSVPMATAEINYHMTKVKLIQFFVNKRVYLLCNNSLKWILSTKCVVLA